MYDLKTDSDQKEHPISTEKRTKKKISLFFYVLSFFSIVIISSTFGALFGFIAGGAGQKLLEQIPQKFSFFPGMNNEFLKKDPAIYQERLVEEDSAVIDVVEKSIPSVVSIVVTKDMPKIQRFFDPFGFFNNLPENDGSVKNEGQKEKIGAGTGFIITENGMIVTNKHVVWDTAADYTVLTNDGTEYSATVLARDPLNDIAVIKIEGNNFPILDFGDSNNLRIGQTAIAIGNSLGEFSNTVSKGIISGLGRNLIAGGQGEQEKLTNIIQTDAAINPGNSGGPLLNISGKVIGINVAIAEGAQSVGFALPATQVKKITEQVKTTGKISTPYIGIRYIPVDSELQKEINLPFDYGVMILRGQTMTDFAVIPGSPADKAGLVENDVILEINGIKIDEDNGLIETLANFNVADEITLKVWHKGDTKNIKVKLEDRN